MKPKILFLVLLAFLLFGFTGCGSLRKAQKTQTDRQETAQVEQQRTEAVTSTENTTETQVTDATNLIDAIKSSATEVTYTKVEYYPPSEDSNQQEGEKADTAAAEVPEGIQVNKPKPSQVNRGAIKSIETYTLKHGETAQSIKKDSTHIDVKKEGTTEAEAVVAEVVTAETEVQEEVVVEPAKDPYRWRYILGIVITLAVILLSAFVLRKSNFFGRIGRILKWLF